MRSWPCGCCQGKWLVRAPLLAFGLFAGCCLLFLPPRGDPSQAGPSAQAGSALLARPMSNSSLRYSQEPGAFHTSHVSTAGQASVACKLQHNPRCTCKLFSLHAPKERSHSRRVKEHCKVLYNWLIGPFRRAERINLLNMEIVPK